MHVKSPQNYFSYVDFIVKWQGFSNLIPGLGVDSFSSETIGYNSGAVIQEGLNTVAVYRDAQSEVHRYSGEHNL